ncbi:2-hydroxyacid dehydrogenase [Calorimonas adulescens]|uniref:2-hydroxyacid dehydrogenase n=1 Tax=Calorimonas adulescens TaxID=2606906 RepID=A0A5D8QB71_9THEO|nr:2-hydroxyacid dehydrogenase [Calorimonas adulescens]TZE81036.1 2-hydroxyacid dehydrogenase [Calorimonas adulescens]
MSTKIVVVGDIFVSPDNLERAAEKLNLPDKKIVKLEWKTKDKDKFQEKALNIEKNGPESEDTAEGLLGEIKDADVLLVHFAPIPRRIIEAAEKLRFIGCCRGGFENIDIEAATEMGIPVLHVIRNAEPVAEYTVGLILSEIRNIARSHEAIKRGIWRKEFSNSNILSTIKGKNIGIVGLGHIGKLVAKKLSAFNVNLLGHDPYVIESDLKEHGIDIQMLPIEELFKESDIITIHVRLTEETEGIINHRLISLMKPTAYLINTARAGLINEADICRALEEKRIAGAALDVFWQEPIPEDHILLRLDNVTLTSHLAGDTVDAIPQSPNLLVEVVNDYIEKGKSDMIVNQIALQKKRR